VFPTVNVLSRALLYGRDGRLTAENGGFRPGQFWREQLEELRRTKSQVRLERFRTLLLVYLYALSSIRGF
jgi:hypothetical protein